MKTISITVAAVLLGTAIPAAAQTPAAPATPTARSEPAVVPGVVAPGTPDVSAFTEVEDDDMIVPQLGVSVEDIEDMDLFNAAGEEIGEVEEVLADASGQPVALAVEVDEGLVGEEDVVVMLDQFTLTSDRLTTSVGTDGFAALPRWDD